MDSRGHISSKQPTKYKLGREQQIYMLLGALGGLIGAIVYEVLGDVSAGHKVDNQTVEFLVYNGLFVFSVFAGLIAGHITKKNLWATIWGGLVFVISFGVLAILSMM